MAQTAEQFTSLCDRLETAATTLRERGCLLQAVARRYYLVYTIASHAAARCDITITHRTQAGAVVASSRFAHRAIPDVVRALYTGNRSGNAGPGNHSGIAGARLHEREAFRYANWLYRDRLRADYGPTETAEPYDTDETDERLSWANQLIFDLRKLL